MTTNSYISPKAQLVRDLFAKIPKNTLGLPEGIYRPDLLPNTLPNTSRSSTRVPPCQPLTLDNESEEVLGELLEVDGSDADSKLVLQVAEPTIEDKYLKAAYVPISYAEGFPVLPEGRPFWLQMAFEPSDAYQAFEEYLAQGNNGARQLFLLEGHPDDSSTLNGYSLQDLHSFFYLYYWQDRSRSYDIFRIAQFRKVKENRAMELEDDHFLKAQQLFDKCMAYIESEDFMDMLTPKAAIDLLKTVVQLQRISAGLQANAPSTPKDATEGASLEVVLRQIAGNNQDGMSITVNQGEDDHAHMELALQDPSTAALAQELVIKLNTRTTH